MKWNNSVIHAIPTKWLKILRKDIQNVKKCEITVTIKNQKMLLKDVKCSTYYDHFV